MWNVNKTDRLQPSSCDGSLVFKSIISASERNVFDKTKPIGFKINNELQFWEYSVFSVFEITFQDANIEIVNVVVICIEVQWQR